MTFCIGLAQMFVHCFWLERTITYNQLIITTKIKVIQANLQFSKSATHETLNYIENNQISIALLQEPYCYKSNNVYKIPASGAFRVISVKSERFFSAIVINNNMLETLALVHLCTKYVSAVNMTFGGKFI